MSVHSLNTFVLPAEYPLAVGSALLMCIQCHASAFAVGGERKKLFPKQFMDKEFGLIHRRELGEEIERGGYPDTGNGLYSNKLSYKDWYRFNILQRIHLNYVEVLNFATGSTLAAGLYKPRTAAVTGLFFILGRFLYSTFYKKKGGAVNKLRIVGAVMCLAALLTNTGVFGYSLYNAFK